MLHRSHIIVLLQRNYVATLLIFNTIISIVPLVSVFAEVSMPFISLKTLTILNFTGWSITLGLILNRKQLHRAATACARELGLAQGEKSLEQLFTELIAEIDRKNRSLQLALLDRKLTNKEDLSRALEDISSLLFTLFGAESAELALFDSESALHHQTLVIGKPFEVSAQAMLSTINDRDARSELFPPNILIQPISFAGTVLGTLRVALPKERLIQPSDREILRLLALQTSMVLINLQYNQELLKMRQLSHESVRAKTGFLANLSHELRGPLGIIVNASELALEGICGELTTEQRETLLMIKGASGHLLELMNDVLDYARIEAGKVNPSRSDIVVNDILEEIVQVVRQQAESKNHSLKLGMMHEVLGLSCDRRHLRQMLINLLTNAIKYTPPGGTIELSAERAPHNRIRISVKDSGVGIDPNERSRVFAAFERLVQSYAIKQVGAGLGLSLTRKLAEMNQGSIEFESEPGKGSTFWISLPAATIDSTVLRTPTAYQPVVKGAGERVVLFAEDNDERKIFEQYLTQHGFSVRIVTSETEAAVVLQEMPAQLLIIDSSILDESEVNFINRIRALHPSHTLPILLLSSRAFVFDIEKYLRIGVDRCATKPIELDQLGILCQELIKNTSLNSQSSTHSAAHSTGKLPSSNTKGSKETVH